MANPIVFQIQMPSGNVYDIVDQGARDLIKELMNFTEYLGVTTSAVDDGATINPVLINGESVTAEAGDVVTRSSDSKEFIYSSTGVWQNFGQLSGLGALAFKDSASGSYTPAGSVTAHFAGASTTSTGKFTPAGTVTAHFTGASTTSTGKFTPSGSVTAHFAGASTTSTGSYTPAGTVTAHFAGASTTSTGTITPNGSVSNVVLNTSTVKVVKTDGVAPSCTMPTYTVSAGVLTITDGSFSAGSAPVTENATLATSVKTQPAFTGSSTNVSVTGTPNGSIDTASFSGTAATISVTGTPNGSIDSASFSGTEGNISVTGTPNGSIDSASFSGTEGNISVTGTPNGSIDSASFSGTAATITVS